MDGEAESDADPSSKDDTTSDKAKLQQKNWNTATQQRPEHTHYYTLSKIIETAILEGDEMFFNRDAFDCKLKSLEREFLIPYETLLSWISNEQVKYIKKATPKVKASMEEFASAYCEGTSMMEIAKATANYPPFLTARLLLEQLTTLPTKMLSSVMKDPLSQLQNAKTILKERFAQSEDGQTPSRLAREIQIAVTSDPLCGHRHTVFRRMSGVEFEVVLERQLTAIGIPFETEANLRARGTARTPDALLRTPVAVDHCGKWKIINWIDSKALFGDATTHRQSVVPQAESYLHRFGPGLVIYWFGHAPLELLHQSQKGEIVVVDGLPRRFMLPTGEILYSN